MDNHSVPSSSTSHLVFPTNYGIINSTNATTSSGSHSAVESSDSVTDWSAAELYVLENGLANLKDEPKISMYVKIAANLPNKTVRDVALRCRWMTRKRRKGEETSVGKNITNIKVVDTSPGLNTLANVPQQENGLYAMNNISQSTHFPSEGLIVAVMDLVQQNSQTFSQISYNLTICKLQDNVRLFYQARNNINAILTDMNEMPGVMSRMAPLPVLINDDLVSRLLSSTTQPTSSYIIPPSIHLKQDPPV